MIFYRLISDADKAFSRLDYMMLDDDSDSKWYNGDKIVFFKSMDFGIGAKSQKNPSFFTSDNTLFFLNNEFKKIIEELETSENLEFVPVELKNKTYYLLNVLNNIKCFDWENSEYEEIKPKVIRDITKLVVKKDCLKGRNIFKLKEFPDTIFFSEKAKTILEEKNFSGIHFLES